MREEARKRFGELRSLLQQAPSHAHWARICELLEGWADQELSQTILPYLESHLSDWDDTLRVAPPRWIQDFVTGMDRDVHYRPPSYLRLVRKVTLSPELIDPDWRGATPEHARRLGFYAPTPPLNYWDIANFGNADCFEQVSILELHGLEGGEVATALHRSRHLQNLHTLRLGLIGIETAHLRAIVQSPKLAALRELDLSHNLVCDKGVEVIAESVNLIRLERLNLSDCHIWEKGLQRLGRAEHLMQLRWLDLGENLFDEESVEAFAQSPMLQNLRYLRLSSNRCHIQSVLRTLTSSPYTRHIEHIEW